MIFSSYQSQFSNFKLVREIRINHLRCPLSNQLEPMILSLYSYEENRGFIIRTSPKLAAIFDRGKDNEPVPTGDWTVEMEAFFEHERKNTDKFDRTWRWSRLAKWFLLLFLVLVGLFGYAVYEKSQKGEKADWYIFSSLWDSYDATPELGTKYFVKANKKIMPMPSFWLKIEKIEQNNQYIISLNSYHNPINQIGKRFDINTLLNDNKFKGEILVEFQPHFVFNGESQAVLINKENNLIFFLQKPTKDLQLNQVKLPLSLQEAYQ